MPGYNTYNTGVTSKIMNRFLPKFSTYLQYQAVAVMVLAFWFAGASAQVTSGSISGTVQDPTGAAIPGAAVKLNNPATGVQRAVFTNVAGVFIAPNLPPGAYTITVEAKGFKTLVKTDIFLSATDRLNSGIFTLEVGGTTDTITVTADSGQLQLQANSGERSDLITSKQLDNLALNGRNIIDLVKVIPGVVSDFDGSVSNRGGLDSFNINGTRSNQHQFTIDGSSNVDTGNNGALHVTLNPDAIAEVKILTSNYQAEYGKAGGGQLVVVTKSGTKDFHGGARWFHRNESMNANNWFRNSLGVDQNTGAQVAPRPLYRYNYAGYQLGGPVILPGTNFNKNRDKLFFFFSQEFYRQLIPGDQRTAMVPTDAVINGDFRGVVDGAGNPMVIIDPVTNAPFPGNAIPSNRLLPAIQAYLRLYPRPNVTGRNDYNFVSSSSTDYPRREETARIDYQLNNAHRIFGRLTNNSSNRNEPFGSGLWGISAIPFTGGMQFSEPGWNASLGLTSVFSSTLVNEFTIGPSVAKLGAQGKNGNISRINNPEVAQVPLPFPVNDGVPISDFQMDGVGMLGQSGTWAYLGAMPFKNANTTIDITDNLSKVWGSHSIKTGIFFQRNRKDQPAWGNYNGEFHFDNNFAGHAWANALLGYYDFFKQTDRRPQGFFRYTNLEWYAQDTFKLTPRLSLDYGMRFSWYQPQYDAKDQVSIFNPALYNPSDPVSLTNGMGQGKAGYPNGGFDDRGVMFGPRLGFAYAMTRDSRTVLRGGFGMIYDRIQGNLIYNPIFENPPNAINPVFEDGRIQDIPNLLTANGDLGKPNVTGAARDGKVPTIYNFSLGIQREIGRGISIDVAYVGSLSRHLVQTRNLNSVPYGFLFTRAAQNPSKYPGGVVPDIEPNLPAAYSAAGLKFSGQNAYPIQQLLPYPQFTVVKFYDFTGSSNYNSLQVSAQRRFAGSLTFGFAYTYSKTLLTANSDENWTSLINIRQYDYRLASWDRPHVVAANFVYDLPKFSNWLGRSKWMSHLTDGFQLSGIAQFMSGTPTEVRAWIDPQSVAGYYTSWQEDAPFFWIYANGDPMSHGSGPSARLNTSALYTQVGAAPPPRTYLRNGGMSNFDLSLFKNFKLSERTSLQLRIEAFNVFNHPNFRDLKLDAFGVDGPTATEGPKLNFTTRGSGIAPNQNVGSFFGDYFNTYSGSGGPRVIQLAVKFNF
jgi:carboxypeptidase family protein/TonB-dependent receptor-like protein